MDGDSHNLNFDEPGKGFEELELTVSSLQMRIGFGKVGDLHLLSIPIKSLTRELTGDHTQA